MKKLLFLAVLTIFLISGKCFSQTKKSSLNFYEGKVQEAAVLKGDTLEILDIQKIKIIKIGDNYYQIKSPTIEKAEPTFKFLNGTQLFNIPNSLTMPATSNVDEKIKNK